MHKPKILCLPGFATNKQILNYQLRMFTKLFSDYEYIIIDPFYEINKETLKFRNPELLSLLGDQKIYSWLPYAGSFKKEAKDSLDLLVEYINKNGPFDAILGFSQGARLIHYFIKNLEEGLIHLKFGWPKLYLFICSYTSLELNEENFVIKHSNAKTIHLLCGKDDLFLSGLIMSLKYVSPLMILFDQGHKIPHIDIESAKKIKFIMEKEIKGVENIKLKKISSNL